MILHYDFKTTPFNYYRKKLITMQLLIRFIRLNSGVSTELFTLFSQNTFWRLLLYRILSTNTNLVSLALLSKNQQPLLQYISFTSSFQNLFAFPFLLSLCFSFSRIFPCQLIIGPTPTPVSHQFEHPHLCYAHLPF